MPPRHQSPRNPCHLARPICRLPSACQALLWLTIETSRPSTYSRSCPADASYTPATCVHTSSTTGSGDRAVTYVSLPESLVGIEEAPLVLAGHVRQQEAALQ